MNLGQIRKFLDAIGVTSERDESGQWVTCSCPLAPWNHRGGKDRRPSFGISLGQTSIYHCFACGDKAKSLVHLVRELEWRRGVTLKSATALARQDLWNIPDDDDEQYEAAHKALLPDTTWWRRQEKLFLSYMPVEKAKDGMTYLRSRGIALDTVRAARLRWNEMRQRILFPIYSEEGVFCAAQGRTTTDEEPKYLTYWKQESVIKAWFFGEFRRTDGPVVVVESPMSVLHLIQNAPDVRSVATLGAGVTQQQIDRLARLGSAANVYLWFDKDEAGRRAKHRVGSALADLVTTLVVPFPKSIAGKDPGELFEKGMTQDLFRKCLAYSKLYAAV